MNITINGLSRCLKGRSSNHSPRFVKVKGGGRGEVIDTIGATICDGLTGPADFHFPSLLLALRDECLIE